MFELKTFLPYQLSILSQSISGLIANEYESKFDLTMNQWRCLVIIHAHQPVTAKQISDIALLDKMSISRAVTKLAARSLIKTSRSGHDARNRMLALTKSGQQIYDDVIPIAQHYEKRLVTALSTNQISVLGEVIKRLMAETALLSADQQS